MTPFISLSFFLFFELFILICSRFISAFKSMFLSLKKTFSFDLMDRIFFFLISYFFFRSSSLYSNILNSSKHKYNNKCYLSWLPYKATISRIKYSVSVESPDDIVPSFLLLFNFPFILYVFQISTISKFFLFHFFISFYSFYISLL